MACTRSSTAATKPGARPIPPPRTTSSGSTTRMSGVRTTTAGRTLAGSQIGYVPAGEPGPWDGIVGHARWTAGVAA